MGIEVIQGDITVVAADAIVNAANETLLGGNGVDGAIHRAAGPGLLAECRRLAEVEPGIRCRVGEARITGAYRLLARHVIHTVGPIWQGGEAGEPELLARCYRSVLELSLNHKISSIAFPAISCGAYGYPPEQAVKIAVAEVHAWKDANPRPARVIFCCADRVMADLYRVELEGGSATTRLGTAEPAPSVRRSM
ncbi:O-acetyl-ADP-ribose deacetylase [Lysobacter korlensis]|uniref:O-acetyl-ADP-ribose deacetylase n=1 Tax=Lysobacter korlensis TaxID=553636 RepID=A0ABV6RJ62_9GAMM